MKYIGMYMLFQADMIVNDYFRHHYNYEDAKRLDPKNKQWVKETYYDGWINKVKSTKKRQFLKSLNT